MSTITVQLDATAALADELALLAAQLADEQPLCRGAAAALAVALDGEAGVRAAQCAAGWAELVGVLAERCAVTGRALGAAVDDYRSAEAGRAADLAAAARLRQGPR
jgi:hypothetical protein